MTNTVSLSDMESMAQARMNHNIWDYVSGGADDEITLERNFSAFQEMSINIGLFPTVNQINLSTTVLGQQVGLPIMAAPTGAQYLAHPKAEIAVAQGAGTFGAITTVATGSSRTVEEIAAVAKGPLWLQIYHLHDDITEFMITKAAAAGFSAVCLTVDGVGSGPKEKDRRNNFAPHEERTFADLLERPDLLEKADYQAAKSQMPTWEKLKWFKSLSSLPLIVKGIMTPTDAIMCVENNVDGIIVSNHGGRVIDTCLASIEALPVISESVGDQIEIYFDSGIRRGTDVFKALALGARSVLVGRPVMWGLAINGSEGIKTMFGILKRELETVMTLSGVSSVQEIDHSMVNINWR